MPASAKVWLRIEMQYESKQDWGDDCTVGQLRDQAEREAKELAVRGVAAAVAAGVRFHLVGVTETQVIILPPKQ